MDEITPAGEGSDPAAASPPSQVAQAIIVIKWAAAAALGGSFLYGIAGRQCGAAGWSCALTGGLVAVLSATGAFAVGALLGLLFGAPRYKDDKAAGADATGGPGVGHNTSLERIADWLTTMIVGLGLVHLARIKTEATELGVALTQAITREPSTNGTPGIVIALGFAIAGFLLVYLWSLRFLPNELLNAFQKIRREVVKAADVAVQAKTSHIEEKIEKATSALEDFKKSPVFQVPRTALDHLVDELKAAGVDEPLIGDIKQRYEIATRWTDEPMRDFAPASAGPYSLAASVRKMKPGWYEVTIQLQGPFVPGGRVVWLVHNSFSPQVARTMPIEPEGTRYRVQVSGAFNIGAIVVEPGGALTRLSLDLRGAPGSEPAFDNG